ncbi:MAG: hypothetical protein ACRERE_09940 [Candidatus Entotheonellia bacterium]
MRALLRGVIEREHAEIGVLLRLRELTPAMRREAATAGFYISPWGEHPRLQPLTIDDLFDGRGIDYPGWVDATFKRAPKPHGREPENIEIPLE